MARAGKILPCAPAFAPKQNLAKSLRLTTRNLAKTRFHSEQNSPETRAKNLI
ncbi:hypothetical protein CAMGR0001_0093 [Campylobacter gracilis RM3268]|uniref:Uncharacterized protein n=1 Tax=Campylobacter gracilis RM3268 TaxID=553220 RepID=C8PIB2_9BACT|nr:hypothetical protein CAMGR0001_0093 [Campylobacter gracilis RM3268]